MERGGVFEILHEGESSVFGYILNSKDGHCPMPLNVNNAGMTGAVTTRRRPDGSELWNCFLVPSELPIWPHLTELRRGHKVWKI